MTDPQHSSTAANPSPGLTGVLTSPRALAAWALVGYVGLHLFFAFFQWILPGDGRFTSRSVNTSFRDLFVLALPLLAVVVAVHVAPAIRAAKIITTIALIEYGVALFFGLVTLLIGLGGIMDRVNDANDGFNALQYLIMGMGSWILIAIAAYATFRAPRS